MATVLRACDVSIGIKVTEYKASLGPQSGSFDFTHNFALSQSYEIGTGTNRINAVYSEPPTALSARDIDLRGSLTTIDGTTVTFPIVVGIFIRNHSTTAAEIVTIGGSTNPFISWLAATGDGVKLDPGGFFALFAPLNGYATTAGTADILTLTPATGTPLVSFTILGRAS